MWVGLRGQGITNPPHAGDQHFVDVPQRLVGVFEALVVRVVEHGSEVAQEIQGVPHRGPDLGCRFEEIVHPLDGINSFMKRDHGSPLLATSPPSPEFKYTTN